MSFYTPSRPGYDPRFQKPFYPQQEWARPQTNYSGEPQGYEYAYRNQRPPYEGNYGYYQGRREGGESDFQPGFDPRYQKPYYPQQEWVRPHENARTDLAGETQRYEPAYPNPRQPYGGYGPGGGNPPTLPNPDINPPRYEEEYPPPRGYGYGGYGYSQQPHQFSHIPQIAQTHDDNTDPALFEQAAHQLHDTTTQAQHAPYEKSDYQAHMAAHEQAYGSNSQHSDAPMDSDSIGSAAAIQAFKMMTAAQPSPAQTPQPQVATQSAVQGHASTKKSSAPAADASPAGPARPGPSSPQDKIVAVAMAQAAKLFDKKNGGSPSNPAASQAKLKAVHSAASTALRLATEFKSSGKVSLQPGELQTLISTALSIL